MSEHAALLKRIRAGHEVAGEVVGNFELTAPIASGGQAVVAEARHRGLGHRVALKLLDTQAPAADPERFRQEGQLLSRLRHDSLPRVLDLGQDGELHYLALELIDGPTFEELLDEEIPDPLWSAERIAEVADALEHCHQAGLIHRDVKPQNVIVGERTVLCDFGLARRDLTASRFQSVDALARSHPEEIKGSPEFMAPEQADPETFGPATPAADVHGLGATLYYLLTGKPPFAGDTTQSALESVLAVVPPAPSQTEPRVPAWLDTLCLAALAKEPERRPPSAAAFAAALREGILRGDAPSQLAGGSAESLVDLSEVGASADTVRKPKRRKGDTGRVPKRSSGRIKRDTGRSARVEGSARAKKDTGRVPKRGRSGRPRRESPSALGGAIGLESADELPAYRPPPGQARRQGAPASGIVIGLAVGIVIAFLAGAGVTIEWGPGPGGAVFLVTIIPLTLALWIWGTQGSSDGRRQRIRRRFRRKPKTPEPDQRAALLQRAQVLLGEKRDPGAALVLVDEFLTLHPEDPEVLVLRGRAHVARDELAAGALDFDLALELEPKTTSALAERGALRFRLGDLEGAEADFSALVELVPREASGYASRGACRYKARRYEDALADFDRCLELSPDDLEVHRRRGRVRFKARDFEGAVADWSAILEHRSHDRDALKKRAVAFRRLGRDSDAAADEELLATFESGA